MSGCAGPLNFYRFLKCQRKPVIAQRRVTSLTSTENSSKHGENFRFMLDLGLAHGCLRDARGQRAIIGWWKTKSLHRLTTISKAPIGSHLYWANKITWFRYMFIVPACRLLFPTQP